MTIKKKSRRKNLRKRSQRRKRINERKRRNRSKSKRRQIVLGKAVKGHAQYAQGKGKIRRAELSRISKGGVQKTNKFGTWS